jgi:hypothetical protein
VRIVPRREALLDPHHTLLRRRIGIRVVRVFAELLTEIVT